MERRSEYLSVGTTDRFIIPLIKDEVAAVFDGIKTGAISLEGKRALDVGCGEQPFKTALLDIGCQYFSLDVDQNSNETVDFLGAIDSELSQEILSELPFDIILCTEVLEHVAEWGTAFQNLSKLVAKGGIIIITCPHVFPLHEEPYDFWRPTPYSIQYYSDRNGLEIIELKKNGNVWDVVGTALGSFGIKRAQKGLRGRLNFLLIRALKKVMYTLLAKGFMQRNAIPTRTFIFYLSNFALLRKK